MEIPAIRLSQRHLAAPPAYAVPSFYLQGYKIRQLVGRGPHKVRTYHVTFMPSMPIEEIPPSEQWYS